MRIMQIAPIWERVPPPAYGGTEAVVGLLADGLVDAGHEVVLYASGDSITKAELRSIWPFPIRGRFTDGLWPSALEWLHVAAALGDACDFDLIHNHSSELAMCFSRLVSTPVLTTLHGGPHPAWGVLVEHYPWYWNAISYSAARSYQGSGFVGVAHNSVDVGSFPFSAEKEDWLLHLSRISPEKGTEDAIEVAKRLGKKLVIAGKVDQVDERYFHEVVEPLIDGAQVVYVGEASAQQKRDLYRRAKCLVLPIKWDEPFGLVIAEAMACGTPVVVMNRGAAPEIVRHGVTGFVAANLEEMAQAIENIGQIDPHACRQHVASNFDVRHLVSRYLSLYEEVLAREAAKKAKEAPPTGAASVVTTFPRRAA